MSNTARTVMAQGRIVWVSGDLFKGRVKTEFGSNKPKVNAQGEQAKEFGFGLAIPKDQLAQTGPGQPGEIWTALHEEAYALYPSGQLPPGFAMKYKDGDGVDHNGVSFAQRKGYAGHIVVTCTTTIPIKYFKWENNANIMVNEGIKCGDYVNVQIQVKGHTGHGQGKPGLYVNPMAVQLIGYGEEIINMPSGDQIFGPAQPAVPQGASATPTAPMNQIVPTQGMPGMAPPVAPQTAPAPNYGVIPPQHQPAMQPQAAPAMPGPPPMQPVGPGNDFPQGPMPPQPGSAPNQAVAPVPGMPPLPPAF